MIAVATVVLALCLLAVVLQDAFEVMLLPRRVHRRVRFVRVFFVGAWAGWCGLAKGFPAGLRRERFLSVFGALSLVVLFAAWAGSLIIGFGLLEWALQDAHKPSALAEQLYMSGATFFTLGYGDVVPHSGAARAISVIEAGTGLGFIAVVIGYLPMLYQLFSRREAHVVQLDARAGSPPTAATLLSRHAESGGLSRLDELLREWEIWSSELLESHLSYPMLVFYRSQHDNQSWLAALAAIMDCCALILVGIDQMTPLQARMTFTMARQVLVEMAQSFRGRPSRYDGGDRLPHAAYLRLETILSDAGLGWAGGNAAEETLAALRATYEPLLDGLAARLRLPLPGIVAVEGAVDHWQGGHRGLIASRLVAQLSSQAPAGQPNARHSLPGQQAPLPGRFSQRLRARLDRD